MNAACETVRRVMLSGDRAEWTTAPAVVAHVAACAACAERLRLIAAAEHALAASLDTEARDRSPDATLAVARYDMRHRAMPWGTGVWLARARIAGVALLWLIGGAIVLTSIVLSVLRRYSG